MDALCKLLEEGAMVIGKMVTGDVEVVHFLNPGSHTVVELVQPLQAA